MRWRFGRIMGGLFHLGLGLCHRIDVSVCEHTWSKSRTAARKIFFLTPAWGWLVAGVGVGILIFGVAQFVIAHRELFCEYIAIPRKGARTLKSICKFGLMARGFVFMIVGVFFSSRGDQTFVEGSWGPKGAWQSLQAAPYDNTGWPLWP